MVRFHWPTERGWQSRELAPPTIGEPPEAGPDVAHYVGVDLGQVNDYTAVSVIRKTTPPEGEASYHVLDLHRLPLGQPYPAYIAHVTALLAQPQLRDAKLVVDRGGCGRPVYDQFELAGLSPIAISIHAGDVVTGEGREYSVPKRDLVGTVSVLLQSGRLKVATGLASASLLVDELHAFQVRISDAGRDSYSAREGQHDDLVLSVACACWAAENVRPLSVWMV